MSKHIIFLDSDTQMTFRYLNNAINAYCTDQSYAMAESIGNGQYLIFHRGLIAPVLAQDIESVLTIVGSLC